MHSLLYIRGFAEACCIWVRISAAILLGICTANRNTSASTTSVSTATSAANDCPAIQSESLCIRSIAIQMAKNV
jgi:hypothetical protein